MIKALKLELGPMIKLAVPVVAAELGWMSMGIVDSIMVGHVSPAAMGAVSVGGMLFYTIAVIGLGLMLGLDTLVSQSFGAGDIADCHHSLINSVYLAAPVSLLLMGIIWLWVPLLRRFGIDPEVLSQAIPYLRALVWSTLPLMLYFAFRRYLQAMNLVRPVMFTLVTANVLNLAGNWVFVFGHLGAPAMGAAGSGWSTFVSRVYMVVLLLGVIVAHDRKYETGLGKTRLAPDFGRIGALVRLGLPAAMQMAFEVGVFAAVTMLIGRLKADTLAAHQIAMNASSVSFMGPLGIGAAAAVRVGQALGRRDTEAASRAGWTATLLGAAFMCCAGLVYLLAPRLIIHAYTHDADVVRAGVTLLAVVAAFQLFDGVQAVITGALRGAGDTRTPMLCHLVAYWVFGLPVGYYLCFGRKWGAVGLWIGLCLALILIGLTLLIVWSRKVQAFRQGVV